MILSGVLGAVPQSGAEEAFVAFGGVITQYVDSGDSKTYRVHTFRGDGKFYVVSGSIDADILCIAGGGGGGGGHPTASYYGGGSGGGGGGMRTHTSQTLTAATHTVTVGTGGEGRDSDSYAGNDSSFAISGGSTLLSDAGAGGR